MSDRESVDRKTAADIEEIWLPLLKTNGEWDEQKIRAELFDLVYVVNQVSEVYEYITNGKLSKQTYYADVIKAEFDDAVNKAVEERLADEREAMVDVHYRLTKWNRQRKLMIGQSRCACGQEWPCAQGLETWTKWMLDTRTYGEP